MKVWKSLGGQKWNCVHTIDVLTDQVETGLDWYHMAWNSTGSHFALCGNHGGKLIYNNADVKIIKNDQFKTKFTLTHFEDIAYVEFSPNGIYLLCVGFRKMVCVWNLEESRSKTVFSKTHTDRLVSAKWNRKDNSICMVCFEYFNFRVMRLARCYTGMNLSRLVNHIPQLGLPK